MVLTWFIRFLVPSKLKVGLFLILLVVGVLSGLFTFSPFEGSVREGSVTAFTTFQRSYVRPVTLGPFLSVHSKTNEYVGAVVLAAYYYLVTCGLWALGRLVVLRTGHG